MSNLVKVSVNQTTNLVSVKVYQAQNGATGATGATGGTGATGATGATGEAGPNSVTSATTSDATCELTVEKLNGITVSGTGDLSLGGSYINLTGLGGSVDTRDGGGSIITSGDGVALGGTITTSAVGGVAGGYISTFAGGFIDTSNGGGNINTIAGGSFTTGTGNLTGPDTDGTLALTSDIPTALKGVTVTKKDGSRTNYPPSADTDTARGLALEAAMTAAIAGDTIDLSPGSYYVGKATSTIAGLVAQYAILDKMTIRLNGAYLWKQNTDTASTMFNPNATSGINDWSIIGPGTIEGSYADTANTTGARGSASAEIGINVAASRRWRIENVAIRNFAGVGLQLNNATYPVDSYGVLGTKASTGIVIGCNLDLNNIALQQGQNNEFVTFLGCTFNKNLTAFDSYGGNTKFGLCEFLLNTNYAFRLRGSGGTNYGHGEITGCAISHNSGFAVYAEAGMTNGYMFTGCQFGADSSSTNKIESLGAGLTFTGCILDSPIFASGTPAGINTIKNCFIIGSLAAFDAGVSAAERAKWKCQNNHSTTGVWASDDIRTTYADDAAAGTGGVLTGELWQQTTTGAIFAKL